MKVTRTLGRVVKPLVNFPKWMGANQIWANLAVIIGIFKDMRVHRPPPAHKETFEEAMVRQHLTEEDIQSRMRHCFWFSIFYGLLTLAFLSHTIYMLWHGLIGTIIGLLLTALMAVFTYRESFWYFQIKTRRLGGTFKEWLNFLFRGARK